MCLFPILSVPLFLCFIYFSVSSLSVLIIPYWPHLFSTKQYLPAPSSPSCRHVCVLCHDPHILLPAFIPPPSTFFTLYFCFSVSTSFTPTVSATACVTPTWCSSFTTQTPSSSWPLPLFCSTLTCTVQTSNPTAR